jgi:AcrR family transcriptional regulator
MAYKILTQKNRNKRSKATRERIIATALSYSEEFGYSNATRQVIADRLGIRPSNVTYHFGNLEQIQDTIMREAISQSNYIVIAQGIAGGNPIALGANEELKLKALLKVSKCHYMKQLES